MKPAADMPTSVSRLSTFLLPRLLCAFIFLFPASLRAQEDFTGHWEGSFIQARNEIEVKVDLRREGNVWRGTIDYPDLKPGMELRDVVVDGLHITFGLTASAGALQVRFDGLLHPKQGIISGEVSISNNQYSLSLGRSDSKSQISSKESASPSAQLTLPAASISAAPKETGGGLKQASLVLVGASGNRGAEGERDSNSNEQASSDRKPHFYALIFGSNEYDSWNRLANPVSDAEQIRDVLRDVYGFDAQLFKNQKYSAIKQTIQRYKDMDYGPTDELLIFFAGHGDWDEYDQRGYLIATDSSAPKMDKRINQIDFPQLVTWVDQINCRHILLVLDVCQGGAILDGSRSPRGKKEEGAADWENVKRRLVSTQTRRCMTSGSKEYVADGIPGHHSPYANSLLEALRSFSDSMTGINILSLNHIEEIIESRMKGTTPEMDSCGHDEHGSNFYFIVGGKPQTGSPR